MSSDRASSSIPSSSLKWTYDVFLSFAGKDTRRSFTKNLYNELEARGIKTFMDDPELQKGKSISPELLAAIEKSNFAIIVLSPQYASSTWCLEELLKILECMEARETIWPILYDVEPCDVRRQTGSFAEAFTKHERRLADDTEKVQRWRAALTKVSNFSGWDSKECRYESDLIKNIVAAVKMQSHPKLFSSMENLIGIDSRVEEVNKSLLGVAVDDVGFIGVRGMGGIGKTTIAKVLFDRISHEFDSSIFISDVRSNAERSGLVELQKKLISRVVGREIDVWDVDEGATKIMRFLRDKKVLLVLDDVNHLDQLGYLAGKEDWFGSGSKIIITTRDAHLLIEHGVERMSEVRGLNTNEALQLFCQKAFKKDYPDQGYIDLSHQVLNYAKGLPLALKVLGSLLCRRDLSVWESQLAKLRGVSNADIFKKLKISYDDLDNNEKQIFLDLACLYKGGLKKDYVTELLDMCDFHATVGIQELVDRSLLTISIAGTIEMHDLLREMGVEIVRQESAKEPGKRSRLHLTKDVIDVLGRNTGTEAVEGIALYNCITELHLSQYSFPVMKNLRVLILKCAPVHLPDGVKYLPSELRILTWWNCPLQSLTSITHLQKLQLLDMPRSQIEYLWEGKMPLKCLKRIDLRYSLNLVKTPDFSGSPYLESLNLDGCIKLYEVDSSVGSLERLVEISLKDCRNLRLLPSSVSGLKRLKFLDLADCWRLDKLPEDLGHLESLEELYVNRTALRELPSCMGLQNLKKNIVLWT